MCLEVWDQKSLNLNKLKFLNLEVKRLCTFIVFNHNVIDRNTDILCWDFNQCRKHSWFVNYRRSSSESKVDLIGSGDSENYVVLKSRFMIGSDFWKISTDDHQGFKTRNFRYRCQLLTVRLISWHIVVGTSNYSRPVL